MIIYPKIQADRVNYMIEKIISLVINGIYKNPPMSMEADANKLNKYLS